MAKQTITLTEAQSWITFGNGTALEVGAATGPATQFTNDGRGLRSAQFPAEIDTSPQFDRALEENGLQRLVRSVPGRSVVDIDARHNQRRIGRVLVARGRDATDVAITTHFGEAVLTNFKVITEEVSREAGHCSDH